VVGVAGGRTTAVGAVCDRVRLSRGTLAVSLSAAGARSIRSASSADSRRSGSRTSSPAITGASGPALPAAGTSSVAMAYAVSMAVSLRNGERPSTAWNNVAPSAHRSASGPGVPPVSRSGARKSIEPISSPVRVKVEVPEAWAIPKSVSTIRPVCDSNTLPGLTSRCSTPAECAARSAAIIPRPILAASAGGTGPRSFSRSPSVVAGTYSMTMVGRPSSSTTSWTTTTLG
jgi:hypothetical protein